MLNLSAIVLAQCIARNGIVGAEQLQGPGVAKTGSNCKNSSIVKGVWIRRTIHRQ